ncbi:hypothetical protein [Allomeiothermus silvanus]|uniref:hypothetical protein n=1 Tax=Allomeiothermus silvanus TaxID=52022 RepID=UPI0023F57224|nr:hypothetical protein [Allomeiothermus silvanus]
MLRPLLHKVQKVEWPEAHIGGLTAVASFRGDSREEAEQKLDFLLGQEGRRQLEQTLDRLERGVLVAFMGIGIASVILLVYLFSAFHLLG